MSKPNSGHFVGTIGDIMSKYTVVKISVDTKPTESDIILERVQHLDLREHPYKYRQLSRKRLLDLRSKMDERTMTKVEYKTYMSNQRLSKRRDKGVLNFWNEEKHRILTCQPTSREWTYQQKHDIIHDKKPKQNGKTIQAHHTYSVSKYPHLADKGAIIFPATFYEHLYGWHGGNFKQSLPGKPIKQSVLHQKQIIKEKLL